MFDIFSLLVFQLLAFLRFPELARSRSHAAPTATPDSPRWHQAGGSLCPLRGAGLHEIRAKERPNPFFFEAILGSLGFIPRYSVEAA